jgi:hypothetical protein
VIDTEGTESTESISHRDTETQRISVSGVWVAVLRVIDTENLCVSVSPWLNYLCDLVLAL